MSKLILFLIFSIIFEAKALCIDKIATTVKPNKCNNYIEFCPCELNENCECDCKNETPITNPPMLCQSSILGCLIIPSTLLHRGKNATKENTLQDE
jgi:hypothetical protein